MVIDHIGAYFFPQLLILRIVGRFSFPIFSWLIATGYRHTQNQFRYLSRLLFLAIISQLPFYLANSTTRSQSLNLNIFFTLSFGLLAIMSFDKIKSQVLKIISLTLLFFVAEIAKFDYGGFGVISILTFHIFYLQHIKTFIIQMLLWSSSFLFQIIQTQGHTLTLNFLSPLSIIFIKSYNFKPGSKHKLFFYLFYPVHLIIIYLIKSLQ